MDINKSVQNIKKVRLKNFPEISCPLKIRIFSSFPGGVLIFKIFFVDLIIYELLVKKEYH